MLLKSIKFRDFSFRLLNSEIGNDLTWIKECLLKPNSFRLLNSEIGYDLLVEENISEYVAIVFVSLTRR